MKGQSAATQICIVENQFTNVILIVGSEDTV